MNPMEMKMMMRLMNTLNEARYESLLSDRKGIEMRAPMIVQMRIATTKQSGPLALGAVSWVIPWALAITLEPAIEHGGYGLAGRRTDDEPDLDDLDKRDEVVSDPTEEHLD